MYIYNPHKLGFRYEVVIHISRIFLLCKWQGRGSKVVTFFFGKCNNMTYTCLNKESRCVCVCVCVTHEDIQGYFKKFMEKWNEKVSLFWLKHFQNASIVFVFSQLCLFDELFRISSHDALIISVKLQSL